MSKRKRAKELAQHYFAKLAQQTSMRWERDNVAEIDLLIDLIVDAAKEEIRAESAQRGDELENM